MGNFDTPTAWCLADNQLCDTLASEIESLSSNLWFLRFWAFFLKPSFLRFQSNGLQLCALR